MGLGLIATGVVNILFGFSSSLWAFALLWALNAFFELGLAGLRPTADGFGIRGPSAAAGGRYGIRRITSAAR